MTLPDRRATAQDGHRTARPVLDVRGDFPMLRGRDIVYLDSAATTLKPDAVARAVARFYEAETGAVSRATHGLSEAATRGFEAARSRVSQFVDAAADRLIVTHNASDAIARVAEGLDFEEDGEVVVSVLEHHSNLLPWRRVANVVTVGCEPNGEIDLAALGRSISPRTKLVAITAASNVSGVLQPISEVADAARRRGVPVLVDGAQLAGHAPFSFRESGCDFFAFSGHKFLGPSGTGALAMSERGAELLRPKRPGGGTVEAVAAIGHISRRGPGAFELGTPNTEGLLGMAEAVAYLDGLGLEAVLRHSMDLADEARDVIARTGAFDILFERGARNVGIVTFAPRSGIDVGLLCQILSDSYGIAMRHGHHCAQPLYAATGAPPAIRASFYIYNGRDDVGALADALHDLTPICRRA